MIWDAQTPIYLPTALPDPLLTAAHRLARDVAAVFGEAPPLRHQPAPVGGPALLIAPDPAYTGGVAPLEPETFQVVTAGDELVVTGADPLGTVLGLAWLSREVLGWTPRRAWLEEPPTARPAELDLRYEQPPWRATDRAWAVSAGELAEWSEPDLWRLGECLLRAGGNRVDLVGEEIPALAGILPALGLRRGRALGITMCARSLLRGEAPDWWR